MKTKIFKYYNLLTEDNINFMEKFNHLPNMTGYYFKTRKEANKFRNTLIKEMTKYPELAEGYRKFKIIKVTTQFHY